MASQTIGEAAAIPPAALALAANDDFAEVMFAGVMEDRFLFRRVGEGGGFGPQLLGQTQRGENSPPPGFRQPVQGRGLDIHRMPDAAQAGGEPGGGAHQLFAAGVVPDTEQDRIAGVPDFLLALAVAPGAHLLIDAVGGAAQGQLAQRNQIALAEKVFDSALGLAADVDFALIEPLAQIVRGEVHQHHVVRGVKEGIGNRLPHLHAGDPADDVIQAFQMLDVNGSENIYPGLQQFIHILPALWMAGAWRIAVRQLIHQNQRRTAGEGGVEIELIDVPPAMGKPPRRQSAQALQHRGGLFTAVGLRHANQNIQPLGAQPLRFRQHRPGFPHPGAGAKEHFQFAAMRGGGVLQQAVRVRAQRLVTHLLILQGIQRHIELQYIDHRLAKEAQQRGLCGLIHQLGYLLNAQLARLSHPGHLPQRGGRSQVVIETARRGGDQFDRHPRVGVRVGGAQGLHALAHRFIQRRVAGGEVAAARGHGIIRRLRGGRRAALEIACGGEVLANQRRAAHFTVQADQRAVGL